MMHYAQTFRKDERLCSKKLIKKLFTNGKSFFEYPFKIIYLPVGSEDRFDGKYPVKVLFTMSGRRYKLAVQRNRLKRLMREAYRKNKHGLYKNLSGTDRRFALAFVYTGKEILKFQEIERKIIVSMKRLSQDINATNSKPKHTNHNEQ